MVQLRLALHHLVPGTTQRVVGQELDNVERREELVADGQFTVVPWSQALLSHLGTLVIAIEVLIDPADGLVFAPHARKLRGVQDCQQFEQRLPVWPQ